MYYVVGYILYEYDNLQINIFTWWVVYVVGFGCPREAFDSVHQKPTNQERHED